MSVTAVLNVYKRPELLELQISAVLNQTVKPEKIFIWNNSEGRADLTKYTTDDRFVVYGTGQNTGVWQRFIAAGDSKTDFVCVVDDDTMPGCKWFENCINTMSKVNGLLGTIGVIFVPDHDTYNIVRRIGWDGPSDDITEVDTVGHSWFFRPEWIKTYVQYMPTGDNISPIVGEDMHFTYILQKYLGLKTYVPPHPISDKTMWGSDPVLAYRYGATAVAVSMQPDTHAKFGKAFSYYRKNGFKVLRDIIGKNSVEHMDHFLEMISRKLPFSVIRPNDGEYLILTGHNFTNIDNWTFSGGGLREDLHNAIADMTKLLGSYIGIPCPGCSKTIYDYYINTFGISQERLTYGNLVVNKNWNKFTLFLINNQTPFYYIGPGTKMCENLNVTDRFFVDEFLVNKWDQHKAEVIENLKQWVQSKPANSLFMFSAGPLTKIFIPLLVKICPMNQYLDCGSSLDIFLKGSTNRSYVLDQNTGCSQVVCDHTCGHDVKPKSENAVPTDLIIVPGVSNDYVVPRSTFGGVCIDIGANCGKFSENYVNHFGKIHYYEPVKACWEKCNEILSKYIHIKGYQEAVLSETGKTVDVYMFNNRDSGSCAVKDLNVMEHYSGWNKIAEQNVKTVSLEDAIVRIGADTIDYLKVHCETSEYPILFGKDLSKIKHMGIEIHCQIGKQRWDNLINWLKRWFDFEHNAITEYGENTHRMYYLKNRNYV